MNGNAIEKTELNKILSLAASYCILESSAARLRELAPASQLLAVKKSLVLTGECVKLLFEHGVS